MVVSASGPVGNVKVSVRLNRTFDGDLLLSLVAPDGTVGPLAVNRGSSGCVCAPSAPAPATAASTR